jgi:membrane associated rhomboid family serine protease
MAMMLAALVAGALQNTALVDALAFQSSTWSWNDPADYSRLFSYVLLHGSASHFFWNCLLLLLVGSVVEWHLGPRAAIGIFFAGAAVAALSHLLLFPTDARTLIGASGAISALFGAALIVAGDMGLQVRLPGSGVWYALTLRRLLLVWLALQLVALSQLVFPGQNELAVAYWAHITGFVTGVAGVFVCRRLGVRTAGAALDPAAVPAFGGAGD